jgi:hypothetical protein
MDCWRRNLFNVTCSRLSNGLKNDLLLLMCVVEVVLRFDMRSSSSGSIGCGGGSQRALFSTGGIVVEKRDGVEKIYDEMCQWKCVWNQSGWMGLF